MSETLSGSLYERRLQQEIETLNQRIRDLQAEKSALERQLIKARQESSGLHDVNRRNSVNRVMVERKVVAALQEKSPRTSRELMKLAQQVTFDLNDSTFRTYLYRLKNKGTIENAGVSGMWRLPLPEAAPATPNVFD